jgi:hypothetical protein
LWDGVRQFFTHRQIHVQNHNEIRLLKKARRQVGR